MERENIEFTDLELDVLRQINLLRGSEENSLVPGKQLTQDANHINICNFQNCEYKTPRLVAHYPYASQVVFYRDIIHEKELSGKKKSDLIIQKIKNEKTFYEYLLNEEFEFIGISILLPKDSADLCFCVIIQNFYSDYFNQVFQSTIMNLDDSTPATTENIESTLNKFRIQLKLHDFVEVEDNKQKVIAAAEKYKTDKEAALHDLTTYVNGLDGHAFFIPIQEEMKLRDTLYQFFNDISFLNLILSSAHGIGFHYENGIGYFMITTYKAPSDIGADTDNQPEYKVVVVNTYELAQKKILTPSKLRTQRPPNDQQTSSKFNTSYSTPKTEKTSSYTSPSKFNTSYSTPKTEKTPYSSSSEKKATIITPTKQTDSTMNTQLNPTELNQSNSTEPTSILKTPQRPKGYEKQEEFLTPGPTKIQHQEKLASTPSPMKAVIWSNDSQNEKIYSKDNLSALRKDLTDTCFRYKPNRQFYHFKDKQDDERLLKYTQNLIKIDFTPSIEAIQKTISQYYDNIHYASCIINEKDPDIISKALEASKVCADGYNPYDQASTALSFCPSVAYDDGKFYILFVFAELIPHRAYSLLLMQKINKYREENQLSNLSIYPSLFNFAMQGIETMVKNQKIIPFDHEQMKLLAKDGALYSDAIVQKVENVPKTKFVDFVFEEIIKIEKNDTCIKGNFDTIGAFLLHDNEDRTVYYVAIYLEKRHN